MSRNHREKISVSVVIIHCISTWLHKLWKFRIITHPVYLIQNFKRLDLYVDLSVCQSVPPTRRLTCCETCTDNRRRARYRPAGRTWRPAPGRSPAPGTPGTAVCNQPSTAIRGGKWWCLPVMELVTVLVGGHDVQQQDVLGLCVQTRQLKLHLREHLPNNQGNQTKAKKNTEGKKIIQKIKIHWYKGSKEKSHVRIKEQYQKIDSSERSSGMVVDKIKYIKQQRKNPTKK